MFHLIVNQREIKIFTYWGRRHFHISQTLHLNRIFVEQSEVIHSSCDISVQLEENDSRCRHIKQVLKLKEGDDVRMGVVNKGMTNLGKIVSINSDQGVKIRLGLMTDLVCNQVPQVDLIMAVPRPGRLERLLSVIACIGVNKLMLVQAKKVEKAYFGSHLLTDIEETRKYLIEGLAQAESDCHLPEVKVFRNLKGFLESDLDNIVHPKNAHRLIAHPPLARHSAEEAAKIALEERTRTYGLNADENAVRISTVLTKLQSAHALHSPEDPAPSRILLAIGPEGGWEQDEVEQFVARGFHCVSLGERILRTDIAVPLALGISHEWLALNTKK